MRALADKYKSDATAQEARNNHMIASLQARNDDYAKKEKEMAKLSLEHSRMQQNSREKDKKIAELRKQGALQPALPPKKPPMRPACTQTKNEIKREHSSTGIIATLSAIIRIARSSEKEFSSRIHSTAAH